MARSSGKLKISSLFCEAETKTNSFFRCAKHVKGSSHIERVVRRTGIERWGRNSLKQSCENTSGPKAQPLWQARLNGICQGTKARVLLFSSSYYDPCRLAVACIVVEIM